MLCSRRPSRWLTAMFAAVIAGEVCVPGEVSAQGPRSNSKTITWRSTETTKDNCVAILGEIATPGAYCLDPRALTVQSLVRRAGGVTEDASMSIRLIRHERVNQTLFLSPLTDTPLLPGDVLIVESKRALLGTTKVMNVSQSSNAVRPAATGANEPQGILVAYLNVLDRPVIVKLRTEEAKLDHVMQMLGQPIELAASVRVLGPERTASAAYSATTAPKLTNGSVLVFPRGSVNRNKLPATLPKAYDSEIAAGAFPSLIGGALGQSAELRSVGQLAPLMIAPGHDAISSLAPLRELAPLSEPAPALQTQTPAMNLPAFTTDPPPSQFQIPASRVESPAPRMEAQPSQILAPQQPLVTSRPRVATLPFAGSAPMRSSSSRGPIELDLDAPPPAEAAPTRSGKQPSIEHRDTAPSVPTAPALPNAQGALETLTGSSNQAHSTGNDLAANAGGASPFTAGQMFGILAAVSSLIGAALLARRHFNTPERSVASSVSDRDAADVPPTPIEVALAATKGTVSLAKARVAESESDSSTISSSLVESTESTSSQPVTALSPNSPPTSLGDLDQLIKNTLPLREEASAFPCGMILQGRLAPRPVYRVDRAAENVLGAGPHFVSSDNLTKNSSERFDAIAQTDTTTEQLELDTHPAAETQLSGPHFGRRRSGAKTVSVGESAHAAMPVAPTSAQPTPLADALRQLQGDRPS